MTSPVKTPAVVDSYAVDAVSDKDRDFQFIRAGNESEWKAYRRRCLTATDMVKMYRGGKATRIEIAKSKRVAESEWSNKATRHGHEREQAVIEATARETGVDLVHNVDLVVSRHDERRGGTPDAIGFDKDGNLYIGEAKTAGEKVDEVPQDHFIQCQWNMYITDAVGACYGNEYHIDYVPQSVYVTIIERDQDIIDELCALADLYFEENHVPQTLNDELEELIFEYGLAAAREKKAKEEKEATAKRIRQLTGTDHNEYRYEPDLVINGKISASFPKPSLKWDMNALRKDHPDLEENYATLKFADQPTLRVTPSKEAAARIAALVTPDGATP